jgi:AcrR family transcriptional regulator
MPSLEKLSSRDRIIAATRDELEVSGIIGLRLNVIAEKAEVSVPLIFKYYGSREGLLTEVLSQLYSEFTFARLASYQPVLSAVHRASLTEITETFSAVQNEFSNPNRWVRLQILAAAAEIPELHARLSQIHAEQHALVVDFLQTALRGLAAGQQGSTDQSIEAVVSLASPLASLIMTQALGSVLDDFSLDGVREQASDEMKVLFQLIVRAVLLPGLDQTVGSVHGS